MLAGATSKQVSGTLQPGDGKAYIASLAKDQLIKLNLQADSKVLISIYSPSGKTIILEDSSDGIWSGTLPEAGFYEFVFVSTASESVDYQLNIDTAETPQRQRSEALGVSVSRRRRLQPLALQRVRAPRVERIPGII